MLKAPVDLVRPTGQPVGLIHIHVFECAGRAGLDASRVAATQVTLEGFVGIRVVEHGAVGAGNRADRTADTHVVHDDLGVRGRVNADGIHRTGRQAPGLVALKAGIGRVDGLLVEDVDANNGTGWLKGPGLNKGTSQLALHAACAFIGNHAELFHTVLALLPLL